MNRFESQTISNRRMERRTAEVIARTLARGSIPIREPVSGVISAP